jgi:hypothetical protein
VRGGHSGALSDGPLRRQPAAGGDSPKARGDAAEPARAIAFQSTEADYSTNGTRRSANCIAGLCHRYFASDTKWASTPKEYPTMIKTRIFAAAAAAALIGAGSAPAFAKTQDSQSVTSAGASSSKGERKICKRFANTASRTQSEKLCLTKADWKKFDSQN